LVASPALLMKKTAKRRRAPGLMVLCLGVKDDYHWDHKGFYDWDVTEMGGCKRPPDDDDQSSFDTVQECEPIVVNGVEEGFKCNRIDTVQECEPIVVNGVEEGFKCNRIPQKALLKKCPWFARH
jgi:hypothetical protein